MNRSVNSPVKALAPNTYLLYAAVLGGGAAADGTVPSNGQLTDAASTYPKGANIATSLTYISTGIYDLVYSESVMHVLYADAVVVKAGASPTTALEADPTVITPGTRTIRVKVYTPAGTLTDLGTNDMLILKLDVADTTGIG